MPNEIDPRLLARLATNRTSRRRFIGGGAAAAAAADPRLVVPCGVRIRQTASSGVRRRRTTADRPAAPSRSPTGRCTWPTVSSPRSRRRPGITVDYKEDFNDNEQWFAKIKEPLSRKQDIGADLAVPTTFMAVRLHELGWLNEISDAGVPNKKNLRPDLLDASVDPGRKFTRAVHVRPGRPGLQPGGHRAGHHDDRRPVGSGVQGPVSLFSDAQDGLGMIMLSQGNSLEDPTTETVQKAVDLVREQKDKGQIRRFTGNDYADDLAAGNIAVAQAYSGDVVQLQADNPDLQFIVPGVRRRPRSSTRW